VGAMLLYLSGVAAFTAFDGIDPAKTGACLQGGFAAGELMDG
jgi:hypothetical protein